MIENVHLKGSISKTSEVGNMAGSKKPLSFSISRILEDDKPTSLAESKSRDVVEPRVPAHFGTIHHYGAQYYTQNNYDYAHFESTVRPRACSTPENEEYPSPTPIYHPRPIVYSHQLPTVHAKHCDSPSDFMYTKDDSDHVKLNIKHSDDPSEKSLDSLGESYQQSPSPLKMKRKKTRTVFSRSQVYQLESAFDMKRYLSSAERAGLATRLNLSETQIKIWFQNRRNKWKRQINGEMDEIPVPPQFATGFLSSPYCTPSLTPYGRVIDSREELLRSSIAAPAYYSHPYAQESRLRPAIM